MRNYSDQERWIMFSHVHAKYGDMLKEDTIPEKMKGAYSFSFGFIISELKVSLLLDGKQRQPFLFRFPKVRSRSHRQRLDSGGMPRKRV